MKEIIYAIQVAALDYSGLKVVDVKIGETTNINATLAQYRRSSRSIKILNLWKPNEELSLSDCEKGVHQLAEKYAYEKDGEKFIFLQESYNDFAENVNLLLKTTTKGELRESQKSESKVGKKGIKIKNKFYSCNHAREILINTANWLIEQKAIKEKDLPIETSKVRYLINKKPIHQRGNSFVSEERLVNGNYIETHKNKEQCIKSAEKLLNDFGYKKDDLDVINF